MYWFVYLIKIAPTTTVTTTIMKEKIEQFFYQSKAVPVSSYYNCINNKNVHMLCWLIYSYNQKCMYTKNQFIPFYFGYRRTRAAWFGMNSLEISRWWKIMRKRYRVDIQLVIRVQHVSSEWRKEETTVTNWQLKITLEMLYISHFHELFLCIHHMTWWWLWCI